MTSNQFVTESEVCDMERREILSRLRVLVDSIEDLLDKSRYYQRAITEQHLEIIRDDIRTIMRTFSQ